jgi:hypothetical protein
VLERELQDRVRTLSRDLLHHRFQERPAEVVPAQRNLPAGLDTQRPFDEQARVLVDPRITPHEAEF